MCTVIGLEIHVQLATKTKLFCGCSTAYFTAPPNTLTCPVCLGMPGALPVLNKRAVELALRVAIALNARVQEFSRFDRKNYFYPDLPKGYQITQREYPLAVGGSLSFRVEGEARTVRIREMHLEEDAGKLIHTDDGALVDMNRCGVPLVEIVTEPDIRSPKEAREFLRALRTLLRHLGVSNADMEKGELRCDANISVSTDGKRGTKTEIKNLNSFRAVERALAAEEERQRELLSRGGTVEQVTFGWDEHAGKLVLQRSKEEAHDYRYFPEPDLVPLVVPREWLERVRAGMPELPWEREERLIREYGLSPKEAGVLMEEPARADYFEAVARACGSPQDAAGWVLSEVLRYWKDDSPPISPEALTELIVAVREGKISRTNAKEVLEEAIATGRDPMAIVEEKGLSLLADEEELRRLAQEVIGENPKAVEDFRAGKKGAIGFLVGQAMRKTGGRADAKKLSKILLEILGSS
ncbi:MAG TPA: Asp-tRNA(Asn)/Glu-tRNA(Gln) amidotransferase subunit GatB [Candidatus Acetothermia bacterium]|nr:MAG: Asp-tRNA(Asn)/Glu-tRNA(Gln) amidotransferase GatCAB subunit B [Candidatus Acetothermia bacterium]HDC92554.1 Asp-tRNA(Asn)/Glu-tRNA(Gln) amidotransferase subunit GatB [Candidatus Acetothermia bacterium]